MSDENQSFAEIRNACEVIIASGQLTDQESNFLRGCLESENPELWISRNSENPMFMGIGEKLMRIVPPPPL